CKLSLSALAGRDGGARCAGHSRDRWAYMSVSQLPNLITIARLALAPVFVLLVNDEAYGLALAVFAAAGLSDGIDGFIAKRFHYESRLGAILDPAADKILLVSAYVMLTVLEHLPLWLVI